MPPPQMTADAPVTDVFHPVKIYFTETIRNESGFPITNRFNRRSGKRFHLYEPLLADHRLDNIMTTVAGADFMPERFHRSEKPQCL